MRLSEEMKIHELPSGAKFVIMGEEKPYYTFMSIVNMSVDIRDANNNKISFPPYLSIQQVLGE